MLFHHLVNSAFSFGAGCCGLPGSHSSSFNRPLAYRTGRISIPFWADGLEEQLGFQIVGEKLTRGDELLIDFLPPLVVPGFLGNRR